MSRRYNQESAEARQDNASVAEDQRQRTWEYLCDTPDFAQHTAEVLHIPYNSISGVFTWLKDREFISPVTNGVTCRKTTNGSWAKPVQAHPATGTPVPLHRQRPKY